MKKFIVIFMSVFLFSLAAAAQNVPEAPSQAELNIEITDLPGAMESKSTWEMSYELRILDQDEFVRAAQSGELMKEGGIKHGRLITKGAFKKKDLSKTENLSETLRLPFDETIRGKLKAQLESSISNGKNQSNPQIFLFYANALIYDAKLKKNILVPFNWILPFERHLSASFETTIRILEDGSFAKRVILPKDKQNQVTVVKN